jgi:carbon monoxide dehydrogenase subunit G
MEYEVFLPYSAEIVRSALVDPARVVRCVPGFQPEPGPPADPAAPAGRLRVRIGPSTITYRGSFVLSPGGDRLTVEGRGAEARGPGSAVLRLTVVPRPVEDGSGTTLAFHGTVEGEGRIGEFAAGQRQAAARRLLDRFAESLGEELSGAAEPSPASGGIGGPEDNERAIPGIPAALEPEPESGPAARPAVPEGEFPSPLDGVEDDPLAIAEDIEELGDLEDLEDAEDAEDAPMPEPEADFARRTMIGRSAEEVDHAPPRGRYAPEPAPGPGTGASATLRWAAPAAAVAVATALLVTRVLRRRR